MMPKRITYRQLRDALKRLGYAPEPVKIFHSGSAPAVTQTVFRRPDSNLTILLPRMKPDAVVDPIHLLSVRSTLVHGGVIPDEEFETLFRIRKGDPLIWTNPATGVKTEVTAASDEDDEGMVIIRNKGAYSPCPVSQLRRHAAETEEEE
jgi:hypothetical protein